MQTCPNCGYQLKDDYGMQTCPGCANVVLIDFDGNIRMADDVANDVAPIDPEAPVEMAGNSQEMSQDIGFDMLSRVDEPLAVDAPHLFDVSREEAAQPPQDFGPPGDPLSLNEFANSEVSQARDGFYLFRVRLVGIDSKETREALKAALDDARFGWDVSTLMSHIEKGELVFERLSPVKASVVVQRCKSLPIDISWEQILVTDIEGKPKD